MFSLNLQNSLTKRFALKGLEPVVSSIRDQDVTSAPARHMYEKRSLNLIHASVIYQIP